jgi:hypothetical protein
MAVQRMTLANVRDRILQVFGVTASTAAFWSSDANLYTYINMVGQSIPTKVGMLLAPDKPGSKVRIDFLRTKATSATTGSAFVIAASSSTGYLPIDYYDYESFYDNTAKRRVDVIINPSARASTIERLKKNPAGPPEAIEILGMTTNGTYWQRAFTIHPSTVTSITPSMELVYYRIPASMPGADATAEYPDAPVEFHPLWVYGTIMELMARADPQYDRFKTLHDEIIQAIARQSRVVGVS